MMKKQTATILAVVALAAAPVRAADRETLQMMADIRMLQQQAQQLQLLLGSLGEALQALNVRLDVQAETSKKAFADQKLGSDALSNDLRIVREKVDDNNVRVGALSQELDALRQSVLHLSVTVTKLPTAIMTDAAPAESSTASPAGGDPVVPDVAAAPPPPPIELPPPTPVGASPQRMWDLAFADYTAAQYDLAVLSYEGFIRSFPTDSRADDAQVYVASAYVQAGRYQQAIEAADLAIRNYPDGDAIPEAYYRKGIALTSLQQLEAAREVFQLIVTRYPTSDVAILAQQQLATP